MPVNFPLAFAAMERGVPELNLSECCPGSVAERVGVVSGLRSSAGKCKLRNSIIIKFGLLRSSLGLFWGLVAIFRAAPGPLPSCHGQASKGRCYLRRGGNGSCTARHCSKGSVAHLAAASFNLMLAAHCCIPILLLQAAAIPLSVVFASSQTTMSAAHMFSLHIAHSKQNHCILTDGSAFFTFLRANLALSPSAMASAANTPIMSPSLQPPHPCEAVPSPLATSEPLIPLDDIPPLSLDSLHSQTDKAEGLELVADSVAEMKQRASSAVLLNPLSVMGVAASWAAVYWYCYVPYNDGLQAALLGSGVTMLYWAAVRLATGRYESFSKTINWDWLRPDFGQEQDVILGARFGGSLVGALVLRLEPNRAPGSSPKKKSRSRSASLRGGKGIIRAWVTKLTHRRQGVGKDMLREAVRVTKERCGKDAQIGFAAEHAHSTMFLPTMFNGAFRRNEVKAAKTLVEAVTDWEGRKRKR